MNILRMSNMDKAIVRLCGKNTKERYESYGTSLKKIVVNWLIDNGCEIEDLKYSLILLNRNGKKYLCSISTCTSDRNNKNFTIGIAVADDYSKDSEYENGWVALFAVIDEENIKSLKVINKDKVKEITKEYPRSSGVGTYYACSFNDVSANSSDFEEWLKQLDEEGES